MADLEACGLRKIYGSSEALAGVDLSLPDGLITVILGPSGCGKTTFLRILAGLVDPDAGSVSLGTKVLNDPRSRVSPEKRGVGMVFQDSLLWPHLRVRSNIAFPLGRGKKDDPRVERAAEAATVSAFLDRYPSELSGGERQRVAIARAIVGEPDLLLHQEHAVDVQNRPAVANLFRFAVVAGDAEVFPMAEGTCVRLMVARVAGVDLLNRAAQAKEQPLRDLRRAGLKAIHDIRPLRQLAMRLGLGVR